MKAGALIAMVLAVLAPAARAETVAIVNARVLSQGPAGNLDRGVVIVREGRIAAVGQGLAVPSDARVIDGAGMVLTPGMVATVTPLALNDIIGSGYGGLGSSSSSIGAAFDVLPDVNPNSPQIAEARIEGITRAVVTPNAPGSLIEGRARLFGGQAGVIHLGSGMALTVRDHVALVMSGGGSGATAAGGSRGAALVQLERIVRDVRDHARTPGRFDMERLAETGLSRSDVEALVPVVEGREPLLVEVDRASDILNILDAAKRLRLKVILSGAAEGWMVADRIAAAGVPVVLDGEENQAFNFEGLNAAYENPAILQHAGVLIAFKPSVARIVFLIRTPRFIAGRAVRYGLTREEALAAVTINPARIFGFDDRFGSIAPGKDADLVLWSGDPLETTTVARAVFVQGVEQPLTARNRALRDRYIGTFLAPTAP